MNSFAFLRFPVDSGKKKGFWPRLFQKKSAFRVDLIENIRSIQGKTIKADLLTAQFNLRGQEKDSLFEKVVLAAQIAKKSGAKILGIEKCVLDLEDKIFSINKKISLPLTDGNLFTAWSAYEAVYRVTKEKGMDLRRLNLAVLGASASLGKICAKKFSGSVSNIVACDIDPEELNKLKNQMLTLNPCVVTIETRVNQAVKDADIIVVAKDELGIFLDLEGLKPNCIICDISVSKSTLKQQNPRGDLIMINAGLIKMPYAVDALLETGLPEGVVSASLAQAMLFTFEERFISAFGDTPNLDKVEEIADIAVRHGFEVWVPSAVS